MVTGPIVKAVKTAVKADMLAAAQGEKACDFGECWYVFAFWGNCPTAHWVARRADEAACGPKEKARRDAERAKLRAMRPTWQMAFA